ncbi:MAG: hypothetical protein AAGK97_08760, partial [Bacteroidota bacterium]
MKNLLTLICLCFGSLSLSSQDSFYRHEVGLNVTELLNTIFNSSASNDNSLYTLVYKYRLNEKRNIRFGLGFNVQEQSGDIGTIGFRTLSTTLVNFRIGYEWRTRVAKKFEFFGGLDLLTGYNRSESDFFDV